MSLLQKLSGRDKNGEVKNRLGVGKTGRDTGSAAVLSGPDSYREKNLGCEKFTKARRDAGAPSVLSPLKGFTTLKVY